MTQTATVKPTTKSGIDLASFEDVKLYKPVPLVPAVANVQDALARLGNDHAKLMAIIQTGLQTHATNEARSSDEGWLKMDENGKETNEPFSGSLVSVDILNPVILSLSRINPVIVRRGDQDVEITWDDAENRDEKRAVKDATLEMIRTTPKIVDGLKRKMAVASKDSE